MTLNSEKRMSRKSNSIRRQRRDAMRYGDIPVEVFHMEISRRGGAEPAPYRGVGAVRERRALFEHPLFGFNEIRFNI